MRTHELKTDPDVFQAVLDGVKTYEIRRNDRGFAVGDALVLRETRYSGDIMALGAPLEYTGRELTRCVSHMLTGPIYGLEAGWSILSIQTLESAALRANGFNARALDNLDADWLDWPTAEGLWWITSPGEAEPKICHIVGKAGWIELWECPGIGRRQVVGKSQLRFKRVEPPMIKPLPPGD